MNIIGIDIGGTKTSICIGDETGKIKNTYRINTPQDPEEGIKEILKITEKLLYECSLPKEQIDGIEIAAPGPVCVKEGKLLTPPNLPKWHNLDLVHPFKDHFQKPIFMNNDANAAVVAEWEFGCCKKTENLVYLTMSTGMGGGIIIDNKLLQGKTDTAGEIGHFILDIDGPSCGCGQRGCFEAFCGGKNVARRVQEQIKKDDTQSLIKTEAGGKIENIDMISIIEAMKKNDPLALSVWEEFVTRCAQGIGIIIMTLNPDAIILGTIAIHTKSLLLEPLKKKLPMYAWKTPLEHCKIEPSILGEGISELSSLALAIYGLQEKF